MAMSVYGQGILCLQARRHTTYRLGGTTLRRAAVLFIVSFVLIIFTAILFTNSLTVVQHVTRVSDVVGPVEIKGPGGSSFKAITGDASVQSGTVVRTGPKASAVLSWADGTRMKADADTELTIEKCRMNKRKKATTSLFSLNVGKIWVDVVGVLSSESKFEISTPTVTAGVRGTTFSVEVAPTGETNVFVHEGTVAVAGGGPPIAVKAGSAARVNSGGSVDVRGLTDVERTSVVEALEPAAKEDPAE